jgi:hypothetical protein
LVKQAVNAFKAHLPQARTQMGHLRIGHPSPFGPPTSMVSAVLITVLSDT